MNELLLLFSLFLSLSGLSYSNPLYTIVTTRRIEAEGSLIQLPVLCTSLRQVPYITPNGENGEI